MNGWIRLAKANYKSSDGTIKRGILIHGYYYANEKDMVINPQQKQILKTI